MTIKRSQILRFIRLLSVEPLGFLTLFVFLFKKNAIDQLIQDKICLQRYRLPPDYCLKLPTMSQYEDDFKMKSTILGDVTSFNMYIHIGLALPNLALSLLVGPFIDKYRPAKKMLLIYSAIVFAVESVSYLVNSFWFKLDYRWMILSSVIMAFTAGPMIGMTCSWSYLSAVTPGHLRSTRLIIMEVAISTAPPLAIALGGNLLDLKSLLPEHEPRNYSTVFLLSIVASFLYLLAAVFLVTEEKDKALFEEHFPREAHLRISFKMPLNKSEDEIDRVQDLDDNIGQKQSAWAIFFDLRNVKEMITTFTKDRPFGIRTQLILLFISKVICQFATFGPNIFMYQYSQRVFSWNVSQYSNYISFSNLINIVSTFALGPVIIHVLKIGDLNYALLGSGMLLMQNVLRLLSTAVWTFYAGLPFYLLNSLSTVGIQAYITKITERSEVGRIFSLMGVLDALVPLLSSLIFANIFKLTIDSQPNLCFLAVVLGLIGGMTLNGLVAWRSKATLEAVEGMKVATEGTSELEQIKNNQQRENETDERL